MIAAAFAVLLAGVVAAALALVVRPLGRSASQVERTYDEETSAARDFAIDALRETNLDYQLGNLAEDDYRALYERQKRQAIQLLMSRAADVSTETRSEASDADDSEIEEAVRAVRAQRRSASVAVSQSTSSDDVLGKPERPTREPALNPSRSLPSSAAKGSRASSVKGRGEKSPVAIDRGRDTSRSVARHNGGRAPSAREGIGPVPRGLVWLVGVALVLVASLGGVAWLYYSQRSAQADQRSISQLPPGTGQVRGLSVVPGGNGVILVGHDGGLLASSDGGASWAAARVDGGVSSLLAETDPTGVVYLGAKGQILASRDGGKSWAPQPSDLPASDVLALAADPSSPGVLYAVVADHGLFRSADGGSHWSIVSGQLPGSVTGLAVTSGPSRAFYLSTSDQGIFASGDGQSWSHASGALNGALPTWSVTALAYDPQSGDRYVGNDGREYTGALYAGTDQGVFKSVDGGGSWIRLPLDTAVAALGLDPADSRVILVVGVDRQVYRSED